MTSIELLTREQVAKMLGVTATTVKRWIIGGELPAVNISENPLSKRPRLRIRPEAIETFLNRRSISVEPKQPKRASLRGLPRYI